MTAKTDGTVSKGLHAKLAEVMAEAGRIPKNGRAPQSMGSFTFVQVGDAADAIRKALGDRGVSMLPTAVEVVSEAEHATKSGGTMTTLTIRTTWTLTDGTTGEMAVIQSIGTGADTGDKASPKAQSNAMKYALLMGFLLSTGDDPEQSDSSDRQARVSSSGGETLELIGVDTLTGVVKKGGSDRYQAEWRETPGGHVIGFSLKRNGDKDMPQVGIMGDLAETLYASGMYPTGAELIGQRLHLRGRFFNVRQPGRTTYVRVIVGQGDTDFVETPDVRVPPAVSPLREPEEAPSEPLPFEPLDEDERALVGGGLPG